jgi:hypothetical protein
MSSSATVPTRGSVVLDRNDIQIFETGRGGPVGLLW